MNFVAKIQNIHFWRKCVIKLGSWQPWVRKKGGEKVHIQYFAIDIRGINLNCDEILNKIIHEYII